MRLLFLMDTDWINRNPGYTVHLSERLASRGHEIRAIDYRILWRNENDKELISKREIFYISRIIKDANIMVIRPSILKIPILDYVSMLFYYRKEIDLQIHEFKPDVIIGDAILITLLGFIKGRQLNIPCIFNSIDVNYKLIPFSFLQPLGRIIESHNIRSADFILSINEGLRKYTMRMGARPERTRVIRMGVDARFFEALPRDNSIKEKYGFENDDKILFFMGWLYHFSGVKEVAIELSKINNKKIKLLVVGDGDAYDELRKIKAKYDLSNRFILAGKISFEDLPSYIACADICLLPAHNNIIMRYIVPIKLYEYMAMKKPVVSTELPGVMEEFGTGNGIYYVKRPEQVVAKALELIENEDLAESGINARRFVEGLTWERSAKEFEDILNYALNIKRS